MDREKREREFADWIGQPHKPTSSNKDEKYGGKEEYVCDTQASTEDNSPIDEYRERKTNAKTLGSRMKKTLRKKLHRGAKANCPRRVRRRGLRTMMMMMMEPVKRTTPATAPATATAEVAVILAL